MRRCKHNPHDRVTGPSSCHTMTWHVRLRNHKHCLDVKPASVREASNWHLPQCPPTIREHMKWNDQSELNQCLQLLTGSYQHGVTQEGRRSSTLIEPHRHCQACPRTHELDSPSSAMTLQSAPVHRIRCPGCQACSQTGCLETAALGSSVRCAVLGCAVTMPPRLPLEGSDPRIGDPACRALGIAIHALHALRVVQGQRG